MLLDLANLADLPEPATWRADHHDCDPARQESHYRIPADRLRLRADLLDTSALLRRWHEQWGAELFFANRSYLELAVDRPPLDPRGAAQAAAELRAYCHDTVDDAVKTGDTMARSTMWSLWWD